MKISINYPGCPNEHISFFLFTYHHDHQDIKSRFKSEKYHVSTYPIFDPYQLEEYLENLPPGRLNLKEEETISDLVKEVHDNIIKKEAQNQVNAHYKDPKDLLTNIGDHDDGHSIILVSIWKTGNNKNYIRDFLSDFQEVTLKELSEASGDDSFYDYSMDWYTMIGELEFLFEEQLITPEIQEQIDLRND